MTDLVRAPWTTEQVQALNDFQEHGKMHPLTCGAIHASGRSPVLDATHSGWICPDPECTYTQDWAHAFMTQPAARTAARQTTGQDDTEPAYYGVNGCTCRAWTRVGGTPRFLRGDESVELIGGWEEQPDCPHHAPAVGQPAEAHDTEARPPRVQWRVEGYDADVWLPVSRSFDSSADAHARKHADTRYPDVPTRVVRETTTWTVEDER